MKANIRKTIDLAVATWSEVKNTKYDVVILPWGAIEPHNYHLPYITDCYLSHNVALDSAMLAYEKSGAICAVMPPLYFGSQNPGQWNSPLCIHTNSETQKAILSDIVDSLHLQGFRKLVIINGHGGNTFKPFIRDLSKKHTDFIIVSLNWFEVAPREGFFEEDIDEHGGEQETSALLHYRPDLVNLDLASDGSTIPVEVEALNRKIGWTPRNWNKVSKDTGIGNPHKSNAEKGERYVAEVTDRISDLLCDLKDYNHSL